MKTTTIFISAMFAMGILISACKKEPEPHYIYEPKVPGNFNNVKTLSDFMKKNAVKYEVFKMDATKGGVITSKNGVKYYVPAYAFTNSSGMLATGMIDISIKEIFEASDMILSDKPTLTNKGEILQSFGEFLINVEQNNQPLKPLLDSAQFPRKMRVTWVNKSKYRQGMPLWDGDTVFTWTEQIAGYNHENKYTTKTTTNQYYGFKGIDWRERYAEFASPDASGDSLSFELPSFFEWLNCDVLNYQSNAKTTVLCYFENFFNNEISADYMGTQPSMCFFKPVNTKSVVKLYNLIFDAPAGKEGFLSYLNGMPVGVTGYFLAITVKDGKFYSQSKLETIAAPQAGKDYTPISFQLKEVTEAQLLAEIKGLDSK